MSCSREIVREGLAALLAGERLGEERTEAIMEIVMEGEVPPAQLAGILVALRLTGEGEEEIAGLARAMRCRVGRELQPFMPAGFGRLQDQLVDTCGTGGDGAGTFNISTAAALVVAAAGVPVAKHGNRAVSGRAGSADALEALGVVVDQPPKVAFACLAATGFGFFYAPQCHRAMAHAAPARRDLGVPTVFNLLGPLTNPAGAKRQLLGVNQAGRLTVMARVLARLGADKAWVVHGHGGLDEISLTGPTRVACLEQGQVSSFVLDPRDLGLAYCRPGDLAGGDREVNAGIIAGVLQGERGPQRDTVVLNAAAALYVAGRVADLPAGMAVAREVLDSGRARELLGRVREFTLTAAAAPVQAGVG
ncbi:MAG: anthranilate phosphoribosyltransferase [Heliobacteriaceae bacterium]|nr:anthranilate phosphoribosyltransferase [Heliobacteriaceae bacterium]